MLHVSLNQTMALDKERGVVMCTIQQRCVCVGLFAWLLVMVCRCLFAFRKPKQLHIQSYSFSTSGALKHSECIAVVQSSDLYKQNQNGKNAVAYGVRP